MTVIQRILGEFEQCADLTHETLPHLQVEYVYFAHMTDSRQLTRDLIEPLRQVKQEEVGSLLEASIYRPAGQLDQIVKAVLNGQAAIVHQEHVYLLDVYGPKERSIEQSGTETTIAGPKDAFTESVATNLSLIRRRIRQSELKTLTVTTGGDPGLKVTLLYMEGRADLEVLGKLQERLKELTLYATDLNELVQLIEERPFSNFPQYYTSERPDQIVSHLMNGKIAGLLEGSPRAFSAPALFFDFFSSQDDYYQRWSTGVLIRLLRMAAFLITLMATPMYVSVLTYHYEMIPSTLLFNLMESRHKVPFSPLLEALIMETTIELLREAGSRLPTKIGQTIGIVGGIVIGQAAVQAGITSNILIISVAVSAVSSFTIPSYNMSSSIRISRFGIILLAGMLGNFGIIIGVSFLVGHLCSLFSLGVSYMSFPSHRKLVHGPPSSRKPR